MDRRKVVDRYYETVNSGDWESWLALAEDVVVDEQLAGHVEGVQVLAGAVDVMKRGYSKFLMLPEHTLIEGDQAAVFWHCEAANANGVPIDIRGANYFRLQGGKITYMSKFPDKGAFAPFTDQNL
jgi:ketosteroid isomerase-like protein